MCYWCSELTELKHEWSVCEVVHWAGTRADLQSHPFLTPDQLEINSKTSGSASRVQEAVAMEPAWRQQGRGRGRSQEAQGERSRPPQTERPAAAAGAWAPGRGGRTKSTAAPEPPRGEDTLVVTSPLIIDYWRVLTFVSCPRWQQSPFSPSSRRSGSPTRLLLSDWWRPAWAPPLMTMMMMKEMLTIRMERGGRSWLRPSPPTLTRQVRPDFSDDLC